MVTQRAHRPSKATSRTYTVYVIELDRACLREPAALAPLYVGRHCLQARTSFRTAQTGPDACRKQTSQIQFAASLRPDGGGDIRRFATHAGKQSGQKASSRKVLENRGHQVFGAEQSVADRVAACALSTHDVTGVISLGDKATTQLQPTGNHAAERGHLRLSTRTGPGAGPRCGVPSSTGGGIQSSAPRAGIPACHRAL